MSTPHNMGGTSVAAVASQINFSDGTVQTTAATAAPSLNYKAQRVHVGVIASATPSAVTPLVWSTPFADDNYTVTASVEIAETPPNGAATEIITVGSMQKSGDGTGLTFVVCNASSGVHDVTVNFIAIHD